MILNHLKSLLSKLVCPKDNLPQTNADVAGLLPDIMELNRRVQANPDISLEMKHLACQLVYSYLPAITLSYKACIESSGDKALTIGRDIEEIYANIGNHVTDCLLDIESGAKFEDRFSDVFLSSLLNFEISLEKQNQKDCR